MSNLNSPSKPTNDFEEIFVDKIRGHDTPGFLTVEQTTAFPGGAEIGAGQSTPGNAAMFLVSDIGLNPGIPASIILGSQEMADRGDGAYFQVQNGATVLLRIRPLNDSNPQNFLLDLPDADYGPDVAPVLHIGGNTNSTALSTASNANIRDAAKSVRYPGAIRLDTQHEDYALTLYATYDGARVDSNLYRPANPTVRSTGYKRTVPRMMYKNSADYSHGSGSLPDIGRRRVDKTANTQPLTNLDDDAHIIALIDPSFSRFKDILGDATPQDQALAFIAELSQHLKQFSYKEEGAAPVENGIILDNAPGRYIDGDRETQTGSINELTLFGDLVASVTHLSAMLTAERERNDDQDRQIAALTARLEALETA